MAELLRVQTTDFELSIWSSDISKRQLTLQNTLAKRNPVEPPENANPVYSEDKASPSPIISFSPALEITQWLDFEQSKTPPTEKITELLLEQPLFFENTQYHFEWVFFKDVSEAQLSHRSQRINESFRFAKKRSGILARLTGTINTANDVGWMRLPLEYCCDGKTIRSHIAFEVLPTKMDLHQDLPVMYQA